MEPRNLRLRRLLDIPDHQDDAAWKFLEQFGVTIKDSLTIYLRLLEDVQGSSVNKRFIYWLYRRIQERRDENPGAVRYVFQQPWPSFDLMSYSLHAMYR
jgi:hypothetical protein